MVGKRRGQDGEIFMEQLAVLLRAAELLRALLCLVLTAFGRSLLFAAAPCAGLPGLVLLLLMLVCETSDG